MMESEVKVNYYRAQIGILTLAEKTVVPVSYDTETWRDVEVDPGKYSIFGHFSWDKENGLQLLSAEAPAEGMTIGGSMYGVRDIETCVGEPWTVHMKVATHGYLSNIDKLLKGVLLHPGICAFEDGDEIPTKSLKMWQLGVDSDFKLELTTGEPESDGHFEAEVVSSNKRSKGVISKKYTSAGYSIPADAPIETDESSLAPVESAP